MTLLAFLFPLLARFFTRILFNELYAVSVAENTADKTKSKITANIALILGPASDDTLTTLPFLLISNVS